MSSIPADRINDFLKSALPQTPVSALARLLEISDKAIYRRIKRLGLALPCPELAKRAKVVSDYAQEQKRHPWPVPTQSSCEAYGAQSYQDMPEPALAHERARDPGAIDGNKLKRQMEQQSRSYTGCSLAGLFR